LTGTFDWHAADLLYLIIIGSTQDIKSIHTDTHHRLSVTTSDITIMYHRSSQTMSMPQCSYTNTALHNIYTAFTRLVNTHTDRPASTLDEAGVSEWSITDFTEETVWMPAAVHCLDDTTNDEFL